MDLAASRARIGTIAWMEENLADKTREFHEASRIHDAAERRVQEILARSGLCRAILEEMMRAMHEVEVAAIDLGEKESDMLRLQGEIREERGQHYGGGRRHGRKKRRTRKL